MAQQKDVFTCRQCKHNEYAGHRFPTVPVVGGPPGKVLFYSCQGCSVVFLDPKVFSATPYTRLKVPVYKTL